MKRLWTIGEWLKENYQDYIYGVTEGFKAAEDAVMAKLGKRGMHHSYTRYGYPAALHFAEKMCAEIMIGAKLLHPTEFHGRFLNCGMAALSTVVNSVGLARGDQVIAGEVLYSETPKLLDSLGPLGVEVNYVDSADLNSIRGMYGPETRLILMETVGNGWGMPMLDVEGLLEFCWDKNVVLVLDNTILTTLLFNPFETYVGMQKQRGEPRCQFIYIESGSKYYRAGEEDDVTLGIVIAPQEFTERLDKSMCFLGTYLQQHCLKMLPVDMLEAARRTVGAANIKAKEIVRYLEVWSIEVSHPDGGPLIYARLPLATKEDMLRVVDNIDCPKTGSFGHPMTTILPLFMIPDFPVNEIRIAVGWQEPIDNVIAKFEKGFAVAPSEIS